MKITEKQFKVFKALVLQEAEQIIFVHNIGEIHFQPKVSEEKNE